jgi:hypothetical protein
LPGILYRGYIERPGMLLFGVDGEGVDEGHEYKVKECLNKVLLKKSSKAVKIDIRYIYISTTALPQSLLKIIVMSTSKQGNTGTISCIV